MEYGLIGSRLGHSYSKIIHEQLCGYTYVLHPLPTEAEARAFLAARDFRAINVTIPYKRLVMEYCDEIDPLAASIGAVNTVVNRGGRLYGYNTDAAGFRWLAQTNGVDFAGRTVLVLGTGGTHNTVSAVARAAGAARVLTVSRRPDAAKGELSYAQAVCSGAQIVVNTTPAGMYPDVGVCALDVGAMQGLEAVLDVVYNPFRTELLLRAEEAGVPVCACGFAMLVAQAVYAAEYFLDKKFPDGEIERTHARLKAQLANCSLIGMPSCGKSTIGRALAQRLGKRFVDLDEAVAEAAGMPIPAIFAAEGEAGFRRRETEQAARWAKESGLVLSCGGGIVRVPGNVRLLRQNGCILWVRRPLSCLEIGGIRPLSQSAEALRAMEAERRPLYAAAADAAIDNQTDLPAAAAAAEKAFHEIYCD
jgi:shikimate dehydrogenase